MDATELKRCARCGEHKPRADFPNSTVTKDRLHGYCRPCAVAYSLEYRRANPEWTKESRAKYRAKYRQELRDRSALAYAEDPKKKLAKNKASRKRNPEATERARQRRLERLAAAPGPTYDVNNPDYRQRARLYDGLCAFCLVEKAVTWDHAIPPGPKHGGSNWPANIYPACLSCNSSKHDKRLYYDWVPKKDRHIVRERITALVLALGG